MFFAKMLYPQYLCFVEAMYKHVSITCRYRSKNKARKFENIVELSHTAWGAQKHICIHNIYPELVCNHFPIHTVQSVHTAFTEYVARIFVKFVNFYLKNALEQYKNLIIWIRSNLLLFKYLTFFWSPNFIVKTKYSFFLHVCMQLW